MNNEIVPASTSLVREPVCGALVRTCGAPRARRATRALVSSSRCSRCFRTVAAAGFLGAYVVVPTGAALAEASATDATPTTLYAVAQYDAQSLVVDVAGDANAPELSRGSVSGLCEAEAKRVVPAAASRARRLRADGRPRALFPIPVPRKRSPSTWSRRAGGALASSTASLPSGKRNRAGASTRTISPAVPTASLRLFREPRWVRRVPDWETNPLTQIAWGLGYIGGRYGTPCGAWGHSQARGRDRQGDAAVESTQTRPAR